MQRDPYIASIQFIKDWDWDEVLYFLGEAALVTKMIHVDQLKPGMFIDRLDRSWLMTPFFCHRFMLRDESDIALLKRHGICHVVIDPSKGCDVDDPATSYPALTEKGPERIAPVIDPPARPSLSQPPSKRRLTRDEINVAQQVQAQAITTVQRILEGFHGSARPNATPLFAVAAQLQEFLRTHRTGMMTAVLLRQLQEYDETLFSHVVDVAVLSLVVGIDQGFSASDLTSLAVGAMLHDVGELRLPRNVFRTTGTGDDRTGILKHQHPALGWTMLSKADGLPENACRVVAEHHERIDGSGYPNKYRGAAISALSQLVGLIDSYTTLITNRGGRPALSPAQAIRHLYQLARRLQFDQGLVEHMIHSLGVYPIGSVVELNTGEHAIVVDRNSGDTVKPPVKLLSDSRGILLPEPFVVDLADSNSMPPRQIVRDLNHGMGQLDIARYLEH
ncbi:MAG TPA: DUF3391 domain-containing protein [Nitrospiraceae bacterium]|nr:DUF3391 domain-containing protein [Nitrospiraceae bacterium]